MVIYYKIAINKLKIEKLWNKIPIKKNNVIIILIENSRASGSVKSLFTAEEVLTEDIPLYFRKMFTFTMDVQY